MSSFGLFFWILQELFVFKNTPYIVCIVNLNFVSMLKRSIKHIAKWIAKKENTIFLFKKKKLHDSLHMFV